MYAYRGLLAGFIYPVCIIILSLTKEEFTSNDFVLVLIEGSSTNRHINPRNIEFGYMCLIGKNVPQKEFFE